MEDAIVYDLVVLGGGSAGYAGARTGVELGLRTLVIDGGDELGGLCILRGCMPSKALIASANLMRAARHGEKMGLRLVAGAPDMSAVIERKRMLVGEFASYRVGQLEDGRFDLIRGEARFVDGGSVVVRMREGGERRVHGRSFLIATGSRISHPRIPGLDGEGIWDSDDVLESEELPRSVIVLGGGAIALEMACYLEGMGSRVTVVQRSGRVLKELDPDLSEALEAAMRRRGIEILTGTRLEEIVLEEEKGEYRASFEWGGQRREVWGARVLSALGRIPATAGLELSVTGVEVDGVGRVIVGNDQLSPRARNIAAAGDVCGPIEVVHLAIAQAEVAVRNLASQLAGGDTLAKMDYRAKLFGVFSHPELAVVGLGEVEARAAGHEVTVSTYPFDDHGKSMVMGETDGFVKLVADRQRGLLLGASAVGPEAVELVQQAAVAVQLGSTVAEFAKVPFYHPTLGEIWGYPAEELADLLS
jgi:pyruvate/2-oxoglutarate dehydrogenase complex dihydrolipoamide dehydrogenase (E3) component